MKINIKSSHTPGLLLAQVLTENAASIEQARTLVSAAYSHAREIATAEASYNDAGFCGEPYVHNCRREHCPTSDSYKCPQPALPRRFFETDAITEAPAPPASEQHHAGDFNLFGIAEQRAEKAGWWDACSGCHETECGQPVGAYAYSRALGCSLGSGCSECGGLGAVWHRAEDWLPTKEEEEELDRGCPFPDERTVTIPGRELHEGLYARRVTLPWVCLHCGGPRGEPFESSSYDGSRQLYVDSWNNPCGHVETYAEIRAHLSIAIDGSAAKDGDA